MPTTNERLRDFLLGHSVGLTRLSSQEVQIIERILIRAHRQAVLELQRRLELLASLEGGRVGIFTTSRLLDEVRRLDRLILADAYSEMLDRFDGNLRDLATMEPEFLSSAINRALPKGVTLELTRPSPDRLLQIVRSRPFQGKLLGRHFQRLRTVHRNLLRQAVETGLVLSESPAQIVRRIRGSLPMQRRHVETIVRTALRHVAESAREETYKANADLISGFLWLSTLDLRTTLEWCIPRDQKRYDLKRRPVGHAYPWLSGPGRIHYRCRSTSVPILKPFDGLKSKLRGRARSARASLRGEVPGEITAEEFLRRQTLEDLERIFGKTRARLFKRGSMTVDDMVRLDGSLISLDDLLDGEGIERTN